MYFQVDFDDGHCPTWSNQLLGLYNVICATNNSLEGKSNLIFTGKEKK